MELQLHPSGFYFHNHSRNVQKYLIHVFFKYFDTQKQAEESEQQKRVENTRIDADEIIEGIISQQDFQRDDENAPGKQNLAATSLTFFTYR